MTRLVSRVALALFAQFQVAAQPNPPTVTAQRAALIDPTSEMILFQKSAHERTQPGSIGKLMTAYVTFWAVDNKLVAWNDKVALTKRDTQQGCTCMNPAYRIVRFTDSGKQPCVPDSSPTCTGAISGESCQPGVTALTSSQKCEAWSSDARKGEVFLLRDLMKVTLNQSTGESADAVAERVAAAFLKKKPPTEPSESDAYMNVFIGLMNKRSKELGLSNSGWYTVHGGATCDFELGCNPDCDKLDCDTSQCPTGQVCPGGGTSALDLVKLWSALAKHPLFLQMIGDRGPWSLFQQTNPPRAYGASPFQHSYGYYPGLDGDKNGFSTLDKDPTHDCNNDPKVGPPLGSPCWAAQATRAGRPLIASALQATGFTAGNTDLAAMFRYGFSYVLLPQPMVDSGAQKTEAVKDHRLACSEGMCFSAYTTTGGELKLVGWNMPLEKVSLVSVTPGPVTDFDVAYHNFSNVTGYVSGGKVKLASYQQSSTVFNPNLKLVKIDFMADTGSEAGTGTAVRLLSLSDDLLLSVVTDASGALRITSWKVDIQGKFTRLKDTGVTAQVAKEFAVAGDPTPFQLGVLGASPASYQVVTATTTPAGKLRLHSWSVKTSNGEITYQSSSTAVDQNKTARNIALTTNGSGKFATSITQGANSAGTHEITFWEVASNGAFNRLFSSTQGNESASETAIAPLGDSGGSAYLTAIEESGQTKLIVWDLPKRLGEGSPSDYRVIDSGPGADPASTLRMAQMGGATPGGEKYITAFKQEDGTLKLIAWSLGKTIGVPVSTPGQMDPKCKDYKKQLAGKEATLISNYAKIKTADPQHRHELAAENAQLVRDVARLKAKLKSCPR